MLIQAGQDAKARFGETVWGYLAAQRTLERMAGLQQAKQSMTLQFGLWGLLARLCEDGGAGRTTAE